jgi:hypothetical protein
MRGGSRSGQACAFVRFTTAEGAVAAIQVSTTTARRATSARASVGATPIRPPRTHRAHRPSVSRPATAAGHPWKVCHARVHRSARRPLRRRAGQQYASRACPMFPLHASPHHMRPGSRAHNARGADAGPLAPHDVHLLTLPCPRMQGLRRVVADATSTAATAAPTATRMAMAVASAAGAVRTAAVATQAGAASSQASCPSRAAGWAAGWAALAVRWAAASAPWAASATCAPTRSVHASLARACPLPSLRPPLLPSLPPLSLSGMRALLHSLMCAFPPRLQPPFAHLVRSRAARV